MHISVREPGVAGRIFCNGPWNGVGGIVDDPGNTAQLSPGDFRFQDLYGEPAETDGEFAYRSEGADGTINDLDRTYLGKTIPGYYYGFSLGGKYKGFDLNLTFRGVGDVQKVNNVSPYKS